MIDRQNPAHGRKVGGPDDQDADMTVSDRHYLIAMLRTSAFLLLAALFTFQQAQAQYTIPDNAFAVRLGVLVPAAMNGNQLDTLHPSVAALQNMNVNGGQIEDLDGIQYFTGLQYLSCPNNYLDTLAGLPNSIQVLECEENDLVYIEALPASLVQFRCWSNQLTSMPTLPAGLEQLVCYDNLLTSLPTLPASLTELACGQNQLSTLPPLPAGLGALLAADNALTSLPALPGALTRLYCNGNQLTSLPALPAGLDILDCKQNQLTALPTLNPSLRWLDCDNNDLTGLPALPAGMVFLSCSYNDLGTLPPLPTSLRQLSCFHAQLTGLPALSASLRRLECGFNPIGVLPTLPDSLNSLYAAGNGLTDLPGLPDSLVTLYCFDNQLSVLPALPDTLDLLNCQTNMITGLPALPGQLRNLLCQNNPIDCLPVLPNSLQGIVCTSTNISCLPNVPTSFNAQQSSLGFPLTVCNVLSPCPPGVEAISGHVFLDANANGLRDPGEGPFTNAVVEAQPGDLLTAPDASGDYLLPADTGTFTVDGQDVLYHTRTTSPASVTLASLQVDSLNDIGYQPIPGIYDLVATLTVFPARPGFTNPVYVTVQNIGTEPTTAAISFTHDAVQTWVGSALPPDNLVGTTATWNPLLPPGGVWGTQLTLDTDAGVALGTPLAHLLTALPVQPDTTPADNSAGWNGVVVGSYDPNDKQAFPQEMTPAQVQAGTFIEYLVRFQNTGTFPAVRVVITDTLSTDLQWNTMQFIASSHPCTWYLDGGVLHFVFDPILLPDSVSDEPNSHGFVRFRMRPVPGLLIGDEVENIANIHFDFNEPSITPPAVVSVDLNTAIAEAWEEGFALAPNPADDRLWLTLRTPAQRIEVLSLDGRLLLAQRPAGLHPVVDLQGLSAGAYLLRLTEAGGTMRTRRFVKQ